MFGIRPLGPIGRVTLHPQMDSNVDPCERIGGLNFESIPQLHQIDWKFLSEPRRRLWGPDKYGYVVRRMSMTLLLTRHSAIISSKETIENLAILDIMRKILMGLAAASLS